MNILHPMERGEGRLLLFGSSTIAQVPKKVPLSIVVLSMKHDSLCNNINDQ